MKCRYCKVALAPLRTLTDGEFCCDEHRQAYAEHGPQNPDSCTLAEADLVVPDGPHTHELQSAARAVEAAEPVQFQPKTVAAPAFEPPAELAQAGMLTRLSERLLSLKFKSQLFSSADPQVPTPACEPEFPAAPLLPHAVAPQVRVRPVRFAADLPPSTVEEPLEEELFEEIPESRFHNMAADAARSWRVLTEAWRRAPSELRILTVLIPILLALAVSPSMPRVKISAGNKVERIVSDQWSNLNKNISDRAAVAYTDDFRSGLDGWESRSNLTTSWSYDASGFVLPGPLAVFRPTVDLTDYRFEYLGEIDQNGMGCAFRAPNLDNYYAVRFIVAKPGPLPLIHVVRYAVIGGKEGSRVEKPLPLTVRADMLYRIRIDVRGSDFTVIAQGQLVDFWSDSRIPRGGVGLFCNRGEKARVRWLEVSHQYDTLGRLCAYLAPYGVEGRNGNFN